MRLAQGGIRDHDAFLGHEMRGPAGTWCGDVSMAGVRESQGVRKENYIYIYVYVYVYKYVYIYIYMYTYMNMHIFKYLCTHICTYIYIYIYIYIYVYACMYLPQTRA